MSNTPTSYWELVMAEKFDVLSMESHDVDDGVRRSTYVQNENEGFRIIGRCRAPRDTDDSISDAKIIQVVLCLPEAICLRTPRRPTEAPEQRIE